MCVLVTRFIVFLENEIKWFYFSRVTQNLKGDELDEE